MSSLHKSSLDPVEKHFSEVDERINFQACDPELKKSARDFFNRSHQLKYSYNFSWLSRPIIQYPQDILALQEVIYKVKPDVIIETGIAHGGSLIYSSSLLCMLDVIDGRDPRASNRKVIGVDVDIRPHNKIAIENHPLSFKIKTFEASSTNKIVLSAIQKLISPEDKVLVCLDSNHTHQHVLDELNCYSKFVTPGSYCVVFDTVIEDMPANSFPDRDWDIGDNPKTAVHQWIKDNSEFIIDRNIDNKLMISVAPDGLLLKK